ncbi:hypothetical protein SAMN02745244_02181 [Tessaracoccus bendigoensis DSM 12906]|uniref:Uncharacterized protein n=1 Tax=Tessaracoccus bendigoensis DSM 12906 TaxID=1123357 RepID=A0A1M6I5L0_9ACTN|nr:hypothetical protein SAMN02745244_02181 [Tessaracoccus bendigoensis DSM 12906]
MAWPGPARPGLARARPGLCHRRFGATKIGHWSILLRLGSSIGQCPAVGAWVRCRRLGSGRFWLVWSRGSATGRFWGVWGRVSASALPSGRGMRRRRLGSGRFCPVWSRGSATGRFWGVWGRVSASALPSGRGVRRQPLGIGRFSWQDGSEVTTGRFSQPWVRAASDSSAQVSRTRIHGPWFGSVGPGFAPLSQLKEPAGAAGIAVADGLITTGPCTNLSIRGGRRYTGPPRRIQRSVHTQPRPRPERD